MNTPMDVQPPTQLCETCSQLDFENLVPAPRLCIDSLCSTYLSNPILSGKRERAMKIGTYDEFLLRKDRCALCFFISEFGWPWIDRDHWFISPEDLPMQSLKPTEKYKIADSEHIHASIAKIGV